MGFNIRQIPIWGWGLAGVAVIGGIILSRRFTSSSSNSEAQSVEPETTYATRSIEDETAKEDSSRAVEELKKALEDAYDKLAQAQENYNKEREEYEAKASESTRDERSRYQSELDAAKEESRKQIDELKSAISSLRDQLKSAEDSAKKESGSNSDNGSKVGKGNTGTGGGEEKKRSQDTIDDSSNSRREESNTNASSEGTTSNSSYPGGYDGSCNGVSRTPSGYPNVDFKTFIKKDNMGDIHARRVLVWWAFQNLGNNTLYEATKYVTNTANWPAINRTRVARGLKAMPEGWFHALAADYYARLNETLHKSEREQLTPEWLQEMWSKYNSPFRCS